MEISWDFMVDLTVWFQGSTPHQWQVLRYLLRKYGSDQILKRIHFQGFHTTSGPKKSNVHQFPDSFLWSKKEVRIMWCLNPMVFRKGQTWSNPRNVSWISAKMGFHWETWPCYKISCKWHLGNMREEEHHLPSLFGMGVSVSFQVGKSSQTVFPPSLEKHLVL